MTKVCTVCHVEKPLDDFYRDKRGKHGRYARCKVCFIPISNAAQRRDKAAHPEKWAVSRRRYRNAVTTEKWQEYGRRWREQNPERISKAIRAARAKKPALYRETMDRHRIRKMGAAICDFTPAQWEEIRRRFDDCCAYCGEKPSVLTKDHVIPLARGGNHTKANIVPACQSCNSRKNVNPAPPIHPRFAPIE